MTIKIQVWVGDDCGITCATYKACKTMRKRGLISKNAVLLRSFNAKTWYEAMCTHHKLMGWEPYKPPMLSNDEIDPVVLEPLNDF